MIRSLRWWGLLCTLALARLSAQTVLLSWNVTGVTASSSPTFAGTAASHISGGNLTLGAGLTASSAANTFGGSSFNQSTFAGSIAGNDYISFTITPASGYSISLSSLTYYAEKTSSTSTFNVYLTSNQTGFNTSSALDTYTFTSSSPPVHSVTLTSPGLQNVTSSIEFRLYGTTTATTETFRIRDLSSSSDLTINGTVSAVPEPSIYAALMGAAALVGTALHRRRQRVVN